MNHRYLPWSRSITLTIMLAAAFAAGIVVERGSAALVRYFRPQPVPEQTFEPFWETWRLVDKYYVDREAVDPQRMTRGSIEGLLNSLGDYGHTTYLTPEELKRMRSVLEGHMEGIGARMSLRKRLPTVESTIPGSPARKAGLRPGDVFLQVNGTNVTGMTLDRVVGLVRGPPGEKVHLRIARPGESKSIELDIDRARVEVPDVTWAMLPGVPVAHIAIQNFGNKADEQLREALASARKQGVKAVILDVRRNPGGLKEQAVAVTSEFLSSGNVFLEQDAAGDRKEIAVKKGGVATDLPLCVLIDEGSASSSEIFAGAIQDHERGKLIGGKTFGTGTVLQQFELSDGSAVLLAVWEWLTPKGRLIWKKGITPDILVGLPEGAAIRVPENESDMTAAQLAASEDKQLLEGLKILKKQIK
jgi:carboxyl-terminal processing protease